MFALEDTYDFLYYLLYMLCKESNFIAKVKKFLDVSKLKTNKLQQTYKIIYVHSIVIMVIPTAYTFHLPKQH
jgi:hypothetical protein